MRRIFTHAAIYFLLNVEAQKMPITPKPLEIQIREATFLLNNNAPLQFYKNNADVVRAVNFFNYCLENIYEHSKGKRISFKIGTNLNLGNEGYS
jgi:hypothetical protein